MSTKNDCIASDWLEEDKLMLLECWARDGYTYQDICNKIGISMNGLRKWRDEYPEINEALKKGREIIDYKVENALLKSALGYRTKEVKVTTVIQSGVIVEKVKEVTEKEQAPNVSAIQCWLYNRLPNKWKKNGGTIIDVDDEDTTIQVTVKRADNGNIDEEKDEEINKEIEIRNMTKEEKEKAKKEKKKKQKDKSNNVETKVVYDETDDLDYWPDDWEDED